jgi:hypothetical protein
MLILGLLSISLGWTFPARADIAPPGFPPGSNVQPGVENTSVRMASEVVTISVMKESGSYQFSNQPQASKVGQARVNAIFIMRNLGQAGESFEVRFPLTSLRGDGWSGFPEIFDLSVKVNGSRVATHRIEKTASSNETPEKYAGPWAAFTVNFPVGQDVRVELNYTDYGATESPTTRFGYILETGAGWYDTIGSADIILRLPYPINTMNMLVDQTTSGGTIAGNEMRWHYENLEPSSENNLNFAVILPEVWNQVLIETENVTNSPKNGEAWGRLGKVYKETIFEHGRPRCWEGAMPEAYQKSFDAYAKAVELLPKDGLWHYGYADLIWIKIAFCSPYGGVALSEEEKQIFGREFRAALALAPDNQGVKDLRQWLQGADTLDFYNQYVLQLPTGTPLIPTIEPATATTTVSIPASPLPQPTGTQTPSPETTPIPVTTATVEPVSLEDTAVAPTAAPTKAADPSTKPSICGSAAIIPVALVVIALGGRRKRKSG